MKQKISYFQQQELIKQLQDQHFEQYMAQIYARQAQQQADSLEANANKESESSDSEAGPKPPTSYMQQGLERPPPPNDKVRTVKDDGAEESDASDEEAQADLPCKFSALITIKIHGILFKKHIL